MLAMHRVGIAPIVVIDIGIKKPGVIIRSFCQKYSKAYVQRCLSIAFLDHLFPN